jgi:putative ABC transport system ATP-binding protein
VAAAFTDRVLFLADGRVVDEVREPDREVVLDLMTRIDARLLDAVSVEGSEG